MSGIGLKEIPALVLDVARAQGWLDPREAARLRSELEEARGALRGMVDSHAEGCDDGSGTCCSACAIALSVLTPVGGGDAGKGEAR